MTDEMMACFKTLFELTLILHQLQNSLGNTRQAEHIDVESLLELVYSTVDAGRIHVDTGAVYQDLHRPQVLLYPFQSAFDLVLNAQVALKRIELASIERTFSLFKSRPRPMTLSPLETNSCTIALPMPAQASVTRAILFDRGFMVEV
ncbi:hypothetical protein X777_14721 [Ooceraea biroi]|uniref:Uncharacterized protein n=1 Tax=Ooceraea biroi TaxID=2015173 RepID=A0A026WTX6_OOCBI|nr:hypothetical protein X777_14721 [Ooceraea biroi]